MSRHTSRFALRLARNGRDVIEAQRLRHLVFVHELGARGGELSDPIIGIEADRFDLHCEHLVLVDTVSNGIVVGTARVLTQDAAARAGGFSSEAEFDLSPLLGSGRSLLEIGRTCLHPDYRRGTALHRLWLGLAALVEERGIDLLFGLASLPGTDPSAVSATLAYLHHDYLAPEPLRPRSRDRLPVEPTAREDLDRKAAVVTMPALIKAYLRMGGRIGDGAFLDRTFGCIDVCMVLDTSTLSARARALYGSPRE